MENKLGRFGHHPDPAIDFCTEVDALEGLEYELRTGVSKNFKGFDDRIFKAMQFRVGGDQNSVAAKNMLREIEARTLKVPVAKHVDGSKK